MFIIDFYIQRFFSQTVAFTIRTLCSSPVTAQQYTVLNLIKILFNLFKKIINTINIPRAFPKHFILLIR